MWHTDQRSLGKLKYTLSGWVMRLSGGGGKPCIQPIAFGSDCAASSGGASPGAAGSAVMAGA